MPDLNLIRRPARAWLDHWHRVAAHPIVDPESPPFTRAGIAMFALLCVLPIVLLAVVAGLPALFDARVWLFVVLVLVTELAEIRVTPDRQLILNDVFYLVPFVFLPVEEAAALVLLSGLLDPIMHPRPLLRAMARMSSKLVMRSFGLLAIVLLRPYVDTESSIGIALLVLAGLVGIRCNDYVVFPASIRVAVGSAFSWRAYMAEQLRVDLILIAIELPLALLAAFAFDREWLSLVALVVPYAVLWRLTLLRPRVDALERADELKSQFLAMASHELRTPLTSIQGFASTLEQRWPDLPEERKLEFLAIIVDQGSRLGRLVDDLLTMSRIEAGTMRVHLDDVPVSATLHRVLASLELDAECMPFACPEDLSVRADPDHVEQIVLNYVSNALKYGAPPYELLVTPHEDTVDITLSDGGEGVPEAFVPQLFERFTQASDPTRRGTQGTGLGLSIVRELARLQGGDAWYVPNGAAPGATFVVRLPRG